MHIIFGAEQANELSEKFIVLELDTFRIATTGQLATAYCIIEKIEFDKMPMVEGWKIIHQNLLDNYRSKNWDECLEAMDSLRGCWGNDLDTFYDELTRRIDRFKEQDPGADWDPVILRHDIESSN
jgi:hypothetical protein